MLQLSPRSTLNLLKIVSNLALFQGFVWLSSCSHCIQLLPVPVAVCYIRQRLPGVAKWWLRIDCRPQVFDFVVFMPVQGAMPMLHLRQRLPVKLCLQHRRFWGTLLTIITKHLALLVHLHVPAHTPALPLSWLREHSAAAAFQYDKCIQKLCTGTGNFAFLTI